MQICLAHTGHIPAMLRLLRQVGQVHHEIRPDIFRSGALKYEEAALRALLQDNDRPIFIAEERGQVLGYCFCVLKDYRGSGVQTDRVELYIDDLCVDESCRGQHIGKALYENACKYARMSKCHSVTMNVWSCNESAMKFYESLGLKPQKIGMENIL